MSALLSNQKSEIVLGTLCDAETETVVSDLPDCIRDLVANDLVPAE